MSARGTSFTRREAGDLKLIDFGLSLPARKEFMQPGNRTGTPLYMAPEVVRRRWTDQRLDIFAMGVSAYQICTYELPWPVTETTGKRPWPTTRKPPTRYSQFRPTLNQNTWHGHHAVHSRPIPTIARRRWTDFLRRIRSVTQDDE